MWFLSICLLGRDHYMSPVTTATNTPPATEPAATSKTSSSQSSQSKPAPSPAAQADAVQLSSAAQAALKEMTETPAQTAKEASGGDVQAKRLLAKEEATQKAAEE